LEEIGNGGSPLPVYSVTIIFFLLAFPQNFSEDTGIAGFALGEFNNDFLFYIFLYISSLRQNSGTK
jgi:hypothetical protein